MFRTQDDTIPLPCENYTGSTQEVERDRRRRLLEVGTLAMFLIAGAAAYRMWMLEIVSLVVALGITVAACSLNLVWLRHGAPVERVGNLSIGIFFCLIMTFVVSTGGFYDPSFAWLYAIPLGAALLVDIKSSWYWAAITIVTTLGFWELAGLGIELPHLIPEAERHGQALFNRVSVITGLMVFALSFATIQRRTERSLAERNHALRLEAQCVQLLQHVAIAASESDDLDSAIDTCVEHVMQTTGWGVGLIWEPLSEGSEEWGLLDRVHDAGCFEAEELIEISRSHKVAPGEFALGRVRSTGKPEWASGSQLEADPSPRAHAALKAGLHSVIAIPISVRGTVLRIVEFFGPESDVPDARLIDILCEVGEQLGRVAERIRLQASVRHSQKLESVGQLAAGIAHEINNPMAYVRSNLGMLHEEWREIHDLAKMETGSSRIQQQLEGCEELISESIDGVDRTVAIVRDMREFARDGGGSLEQVPIDELVESSLRVASSAKPMGTVVETRLEPGLVIECMATRMRQVFLNLVMNAFHALGENGHLRIRSRSNGDRIIVTIEDDGHGIDERDREHIFEPFYTTKPVGQCTGLGLYISFEIIRSIGGTIEVESNPGIGTRFILNLPTRGAHEEG